eukprot:604711-Pelagomonas_calceolata.AAC.1
MHGLAAAAAAAAAPESLASDVERFAGTLGGRSVVAVSYYPAAAAAAAAAAAVGHAAVRVPKAMGIEVQVLTQSGGVGWPYWALRQLVQANLCESGAGARWLVLRYHECECLGGEFQPQGARRCDAQVNLCKRGAGARGLVLRWHECECLGGECQPQGSRDVMLRQTCAREEQGRGGWCSDGTSANAWVGSAKYRAKPLKEKAWDLLSIH